MIFLGGLEHFSGKQKAWGPFFLAVHSASEASCCWCWRSSSTCHSPELAKPKSNSLAEVPNCLVKLCLCWCCWCIFCSMLNPVSLCVCCWVCCSTCFLFFHVGNEVTTQKESELRNRVSLAPSVPFRTFVAFRVCTMLVIFWAWLPLWVGKKREFSSFSLPIHIGSELVNPFPFVVWFPIRLTQPCDLRRIDAFEAWLVHGLFNHFETDTGEGVLLYRPPRAVIAMVKTNN